MDQIKKKYGYLNQQSIERAKSVLQEQCETMRQYYDDEVYGYKITKNGYDPEDMETDSWWGFYGDDHEESGLLEHARNAIDCHIAQLIKLDKQLEEGN